MQCQITYKSDCIPYQYFLRLNIADETSDCSISVFGKTLQPYFGLAAIEMQKILNLQHSDQIMEALKKTFVGKCFIFQLKTPLLNKKNSSSLCLLSVVKKHDSSSFGSNLVAYKIISNKNTDNDTVYSYLMQYNQFTYSKKPKINKLHSLQTTEIMDFESSTSCSILPPDSISQESLILSWETKEFDCQNLKIPLIDLYFDKSSSFLLDYNPCKVRELTFTDKKKSLSLFSFDENKNSYREPNHSQFLFTETSANIKTYFKNTSKKKNISCPHFEKISISEMHKDDEIKKKVISVRLNESRNSVSNIIKTEDLAIILNDFDERICDECSLKIIDTCKKYFNETSKSILCSENSSLYLLEDVSNFIKEYSEVTNHTYLSTAGNLSEDLFETMFEKTSNSSKKLNASNHHPIFLKSITHNLQNETDTMSFYKNQKSSLLLCKPTPNKYLYHLYEDSKDFQFFCSTQSDMERKSHLSVIIPALELQRREKQRDNLKTIFSQNKVNKETVKNIQNASYQYSKSTENKENVTKCIDKTHFICLPFKSYISPASPFNKLSSKSSYISKMKTNIKQKTFASTPISKSSVWKNVPFLTLTKNCSPPLDDAFGTPIQRTDFIPESVYYDSPSLEQKKSPYFHGFATKTTSEENEVSFDLFTSLNDSHKMLPLSLQISTKKMNEFSQDLFSPKSNQSPTSSISKCFSRNNSMTPLSLKSRNQYLTPQKNYRRLTKRKMLPTADDFFD